MEEIKVNSAKKRVEINFIGSYSGEMERFGDELKSSVRLAKAGGTNFDLLSDFTQSHVVPQQLLGGAAEFVGWCADNGLRKSAIIIGSMLLKLQMDRLTPDERFKTFVSREEAEAWLDE
jgi:hypothetical protein